MKIANRFALPLLGTAVFSATLLLPGCSGDTEDVHVTYCRDLIETRVGASPAIQWKGSDSEIHRPDYAKIILNFEAKQGDADPVPMQAACYYKYATADENVMTHTNPLSAYATVPYRLTVNGRDVSVEVLHAVVKEAALQQGRELVEWARKEANDAAKRVDEAFKQ